MWEGLPYAKALVSRFQPLLAVRARIDAGVSEARREIGCQEGLELHEVGLGLHAGLQVKGIRRGPAIDGAQFEGAIFGRWPVDLHAAVRSQPRLARPIPCGAAVALVGGEDAVMAEQAHT